MFIKEAKTDLCQNRFGGNGEVIIEHLLDESLISDKMVMYAKVILKPGCSLGYHKHEGNSETVHVLQGTGTYNDNGTVMAVKAGDTMFCPDGESHSVENSGSEDLVLLGLVVKS